MSQEFGVTGESRSLSMIETWIKALTQPNEEAYTDIINDPEANANRAYWWIFISTLIGSLVYLFLSSLLSTNPYIPAGEPLGSMVFVLVCGAPIAAVASVLGVMINAGITQLVATALGGTGTYSKLVYAFAAYSAPISVISSVLGIIPFINCLTLPLGLYAILLNVTAVKAVNKFSWGKAIASSIIIIGLIVVLAAVFIIIILALLGPAIGNVFSDIITELGTPGP